MATSDAPEPAKGNKSRDDASFKRPTRAVESNPNKRVRTYFRRKTEIEELTSELKELEQQNDHYKYLELLLQQRKDLSRSLFENGVMHGASQAQRLAFVSSMSLLSQFFREVDVGPFDLPTRLGKDPAQREAALIQMRVQRLQVARQFMLLKHCEVGMSEFYDRKTFEATNGDKVSTNFEIIPLPEATSIKAIVDAFQSFVYNIEISISEAVGDITVRQNDDSTLGSPVAQHCLVTTFADNVRVEANNVAFSEYRLTGPGSDGEFGLFVCDVVDEDRLFPYRPRECVRQDLTMVLMLARHQVEGRAPMIFLTRWWCLRIRKSELNIPAYVVERIRYSVDRVAASMLAAARTADANSQMPQ